MAIISGNGPLRQRYFHAQNNRLINPRCLESRETLQQRRSATPSLRVAILIFVDKQAVPATFIDFLQALTLQIPLEIGVWLSSPILVPEVTWQRRGLICAPPLNSLALEPRH